jgi:putative glutamine amidotransferase
LRPLIGITCDLDLGNGRETRTPGRKVHVLYDDYVQAVAASGGLPLLLPAQAGVGSLEAYAGLLHGLLIPGSPADVDPAHYGEEPHARLGPVNPLRTEFEMRMVRLALQRHVPVFGICGGAQVLNVALGGSLYQDIPSQVTKAYKHSGASEPAHTVDILPGTRLAAILGIGEMRVNSLHHQAVKAPGQDLVVSASSRDGVVEAVEISHAPFILGVQWHPERLFADDEPSQRLFTTFVQVAMAVAAST